MKLAWVIGQLVATIKHPDHQGCKLLLVEPLDARGRKSTPGLVAIDAVDAGVGDVVLLLEEGKGARAVLESDSVPCEAMIVGIVDHLQLKGQRLRPEQLAE